MNIKRIQQVLTWSLITNKRDLVSFIYGLAGISFLFVFFNSLGNYFNGVADWHGINSSASINVFIMSILFLAGAAQVLYNTKNRTGFVNFMMLPASNTEKFSACVIYQTVVKLICMFAAFALADVLQAVISFATTHDAYSLTWATATKLYDGLATDDFFITIAVILFVHSTFILGGCFFRRRQMLYTLLMWIVVPMIILLLLTFIGLCIAEMISEADYQISVEVDQNAGSYLIYIVGCASLIFAILNYWLSYRVFRRIELINNRFYN